MNQKNHKIIFGTKSIQVPNGELLLFSLLENNLYQQGTSQKRARGAFCGMGVCQECLVEVKDGEDYLACQTIVEEDMEIINYE